jgi:hypothetical protein
VMAALLHPDSGLQAPSPEEGARFRTNP